MMEEEEFKELAAKMLPSHCNTIGKMERLKGGLANNVFRVFVSDSPSTTTTFIFKHYPPHLASNPSIPLDQSRYFIEKIALHLLSSSKDQMVVKTPKLLHWNDEKYCLIMEDAGPNLITLLEFFRERKSAMSTDWSAVFASRICSFLSRLNSLCPERWDELRKVSQPTWNILNSYYLEDHARKAEEYGLTDELAPFLADLKPYSEPAEGLGCLIHGDLWPNSILIRRDGNEDDFEIWILDWEVSRISYASSDIEQFMANLWVMSKSKEAFNNQGVNDLMRAFENEIKFSPWTLIRKQESVNNFVRWVLLLAQYSHWELGNLSKRDLVKLAIDKAIKDIVE